MNASEIIQILIAVVEDVPTLIQVVEKIIEIYKSKEAPTEQDWEEINALCDKTHEDLQK
ncbi:hypothetical protein M2305_003272 [Gluconobacter cerinus]|uniref:hypothetical protein n=1 Tax=Gluconobacter cerinus TaxID=38307 RepID=UPI001B8BBF60|nr:hypothetical protein [Gluconobacter cerinus]MBS0984597.1 hypothetical protein [Gluconobacter cerinus]MCW2267253.1 hypothetical protein [Gluconobacter cerinus]